MRRLRSQRQPVWETLFAQCCEADVVLFDGTFWAEAELPQFATGAGTATEMGHVPIGGAAGSAGWLARLGARTRLYVHVNNTNPLLDPGSPERAGIRRLGLDVADDGWEAVL